MDDILIIDKPEGITSHDVVDIVRRKLKIKKAGHCGTLDPMATGVMVIVMNKATKQSAQFSCHEKEYVCRMRLGISTDTYDSTGKVTAEKNTDSITQESVRQVILSFKGPQKQVPPMFSAKYHNGKRLYKLAKKGITVERKPVDIDVKEIEILDISNQDIEIRVTCSKGTYIRSLCNDIGQRLGCGAHMNALRRIRSGMFDISQAVRLEDIK